MERVNGAHSQADLYRELLSLCEIADQGGMHAVWTGEHHGMNFTIAPNPFLNLVDLAHRTRNVRLGTATVIAPFWHPIKLAGEAAMTDLLTDGRLEIGIARGAYSFEYERLLPGLDAWGAGQRMRELIPAVKGLWQGDYAHDGEFWQFPSTTSSPKPVQIPHPPLWVAARDPICRGHRTCSDQPVGHKSNDLRICQLHGCCVSRLRYDQGGGSTRPRERRRGAALPPAHSAGCCRVARSLDHLDGTSSGLDPLAASSVGRSASRGATLPATTPRNCAVCGAPRLE